MEFSAVILAGGASTRMGRDKTWLQVEGESLLMHQLALVKRLRPIEIFISGRGNVDYSCTDCPVLLDREPGCGPLAGLERALASSSALLLLALPVDTPCLRPSLLRALLSRCTPETGALPLLGGRIEPLVGFYPTAAHSLLESRLRRRSYAAREFSSACVQAGLIHLLEIDEADHPCFANWNRPEDARMRAQQELTSRSKV